MEIRHNRWMKWLKRYPDQLLCFWLGLVPTGICIGAFVALANFVLDAMGNGLDSACDTLYGFFAQQFLLFGIPAGLFGVLVGYFLQKLSPHSACRWMWLALLIPSVTFQLAQVQMCIVAFVENGTVSDLFSHSFSEFLFVHLCWAAVALAAGTTLIAFIGMWKLLVAARNVSTVVVLSPEIS